MGTKPGLDGLQSFRFGLCDDVSEMSRESGDGAFVMATFTGQGDLMHEVHRILEAARTTDESGLTWFRVSLSAVMRAVSIAMSRRDT